MMKLRRREGLNEAVVFLAFIIVLSLKYLQLTGFNTIV